MASFFRTLFVFALGGIAGFVAAHLVNQNPAGEAFFDEVNAKLRDFREGVSSGYREREAELRNEAS